MRASNPSASGSSGISMHNTRASRMASAVRLAADQIATGAGRVALVEEQVEDRQHRRRPLHELVRRRHCEGDAGMADLALGPHEALRHRGLGTRKARAISAVVMPGQRAQREGHLGLERQCRVAAREHQAQAIVGNPLVPRTAGSPRSALLHGRHLLHLRDAHVGPPWPVDGAVAGHGRQPGAWAARDAVARPALQRRREGVLRALLGEVPVTREADQGRHDPAPLGLECLGDGGLDLGTHMFPDRPHFDRCRAGARDLRRHLDGLVEVLAVDDVVAADLLLGLGERAVGGEHVAVPHADGGGVASCGRRRSPPCSTPRSAIVLPNSAYSFVMASPCSAVALCIWLSSPAISNRYRIVPPGWGLVLLRRSGTARIDTPGPKSCPSSPPYAPLPCPGPRSRASSSSRWARSPPAGGAWRGPPTGRWSSSATACPGSGSGPR